MAGLGVSASRVRASPNLQPRPGNCLPSPWESLRRRSGSSRESAFRATASRRDDPVHPVYPCSIEPFAGFGRVQELFPGRVVPPGSAGVPPACSSFRCFRHRLRGSTLMPTLFHGLTLPFPRGRCSCCRTGRPQGSSGFTSEAKCCRRFAAERGLDLLEGLRPDRQDALRVDQVALHSSLFTLHSSLFTFRLCASPSHTTGRGRYLSEAVTPATACPWFPGRREGRRYPPGRSRPRRSPPNGRDWQSPPLRRGPSAYPGSRGPRPR